MEKIAMQKLAFDLGTKVALEQLKIAAKASDEDIRSAQLAGLGGGPLLAAALAPGHRMGAGVGSGLGTVGGALGGALGGAGLGYLGGKALDSDPTMWAAILANLGGLGGGLYGGWKGTEYGMNNY
jgi:hypothetical protein